MKNLVFISLAAIGLVATSAPASAEVDKHDIYGNYQGSTAPSNGGYDNRFSPADNGVYGGGYYRLNLFDALFISLFRSHKPVACYDVHGNLFLVRGKKAVLATGPQTVEIKRLAAVTTTCGESTYSAVAAPEPAQQATPTSAPETPQPATFKIGNVTYHCSIQGGKHLCQSE
ncbi:hypothetical protein BH11PAT2_BH11PAT2_08840 [soil metagenome]